MGQERQFLFAANQNNRSPLFKTAVFAVVIVLKEQSGYGIQQDTEYDQQSHDGPADPGGPAGEVQEQCKQDQQDGVLLDCGGRNLHHALFPYRGFFLVADVMVEQHDPCCDNHTGKNPIKRVDSVGIGIERSQNDIPEQHCQKIGRNLTYNRDSKHDSLIL